jgi:hypothetical protein
MKGVPPFKATAKGNGVYDIWMNPPVKDGYTEENKKDKNDLDNQNSTGYESREANVEEAESWQQLERGMQNDNSVEYFADKMNNLQDGTPDWIRIWYGPDDIIEVVICNGRTILRNGHHRITAAIKSGYKGKIPYKVVPLSDVVGPNKQFLTINDLLDAAQ